MPASQPSSRSASFTGASIIGTSVRPVCSAASMAMASSRSIRTCWTWVLWVTTSFTRRAPSSVAFSTANSSALFLTTAISRSTSGPTACGRTCSSARSTTPFLRISLMTQRHSPSRPLKTSRLSPVFSRITWVR